jgi:hypothetical protein
MSSHGCMDGWMCYTGLAKQRIYRKALPHETARTSYLTYLNALRARSILYFATWPVPLYRS